MTRRTVATSVAVLAFVFPAPDATHLPAGHAASPLARSTVDDTLELRRIGRTTSDRRDGPGIPASLTPDLSPATPRMPLFPADRAHRERLERAVERFGRAGLMLPELEVIFSDSDDSCQGHLGLFDRTPTPWRISVCSEFEFVLTHELAHAWVAANLNEAQRTAYTAYRGLSAWRDLDLPWRERGTEDAAFVMQQVLMTKHIRLDSPIWVERVGAFEQLTGRPPPLPDVASTLSPGTAHCQQRSPAPNVARWRHLSPAIRSIRRFGDRR